MKNITKHTTAKQKRIASSQVSWLLHKVSKDVRCILNRTMEHIKTSIIEKNTCNILPVTHKLITTKICQEGVYLLVSCISKQNGVPSLNFINKNRVKAYIIMILLKMLVEYPITNCTFPLSLHLFFLFCSRHIGCP